MLQSHGSAVVLHSDTIVGVSVSFLDPEGHLRGEVVKTVIGGADQLQLVLDVSLIVLLLEALHLSFFFMEFACFVEPVDVLFEGLFGALLVGLGPDHHGRVDPFLLGLLILLGSLFPVSRPPVAFG